MDATQIASVRDDLDHFLARFDDCFNRKDARSSLGVYVRGQLSDLEAKSCEPIALAAGKKPRSLQLFLSRNQWDEDLMRSKIAEIVTSEHSGPNSIGIIDETSDTKKGDKTPGVQRQWCGSVGKTENGIVTVHLSYAQGDFHTLLDGDLFLPESWSNDRPRCREAGIPDEVVYRPKWQIALELQDRALTNGVSFKWLTFDEGYGGKPGYLEGLHDREQKFIGEVPRSFSVWKNRPEVIEADEPTSGRGRPRNTPRLADDAPSAVSVESLRDDPAMKSKKWIAYHIKDGEKGPCVWEAKRMTVWLKKSNGLPGQQLHLVVARNVLNPDEIKFFIAEAPPGTHVSTLLLVAFSRWRVERCFQDQKQEVGLDQWEGRQYLSLKRHLIVTSLSFLFLARTRDRVRGEKYRGDNSASSQSSIEVHRLVVARSGSTAATC